MMCENYKKMVLLEIAEGKECVRLPKHKWNIDDKKVHVRFCSTNMKSIDKYKFNINPNTLSSDYELWICGNSDCYYLLPVSVIRKMYNDRDTYIDNHHPNLRVVTLDASKNTVMYARKGRQLGIRQYLKAKIDDLR